MVGVPECVVHDTAFYEALIAYICFQKKDKHERILIATY